MLTVVVVLSVRPGHTPAVKEAVRAQLRRPGAAQGFVTLLATEIGEVNTLWAFYACEDLTASLTRLDAWVDELRREGADPWLRHVRVEAFRLDPAGPGLDDLATPAGAAVLLQEVDGMPAPETRQGIVLHPLSGTQGRRWVLTPVASQDEAMDRALLDGWRNDLTVRRSALLIPAV